MITDGANWSANPTQWTDVRDTYVRSGIRLEIMGFQVSRDRNRERTAYTELTEKLAPSSPLITYWDTNEVDELEKAIVEALRLGAFEVASAGKRVPPGPLDLGGTWQRTKTEFQPGPYELGIVDNPNARSKILLEGGEGMDVHYREGMLMHGRFDFELEKSIGAGTPESGKFFVGIHTPKNEDGMLVFDISVQNADAQFVLAAAPTRVGHHPSNYQWRGSAGRGVLRS